MEATVWGPAGWFFIHSVAMAYPDTPTKRQRKAAIDFFASLREVLPCEDCKKHYCANCDDKRLETAIQSRKALIRWTIDLHNKVNLSLGKPHMSYKKALLQLEQRYEEGKPWRGPSRAKMSRACKIILLVVAIVVSLVISGCILRAWIKSGCP